MSNFTNKPFAVFYNKNPNKKEIEALQIRLNAIDTEKLDKILKILEEKK